jgi:hypothetical protein
LVFSFLFFVLPVALYKSSTTLTENALFQMKVGGMDVEISEPLSYKVEKPDSVLTAKLLLRTPEFYYLRPIINSPDSVVIVRTEHVSLKYKHKL